MHVERDHTQLPERPTIKRHGPHGRTLMATLIIGFVEVLIVGYFENIGGGLILHPPLMPGSGMGGLYPQ